MNCACSYCPSSGSPLGEDFPSNSHAQSDGYVTNHTYIGPHCVVPIPVATAPRLPSEGCTMAMDQGFEDALHPDHAQQPPDWMIDYWFHYLGLSLDTAPLETHSTLPTLPSSFPVCSDTNGAVSQSFLIQTQSNTLLLVRAHPLGRSPDLVPTGHSQHLESQD